MTAPVSDSGRPIPAVPRDGRIAASCSQERMWLFQQMHPEAVAYNSQVALHVTGPLDAAALERSLDEIVRRHEVYRTSLHEVDGTLVQRVHHDAGAALDRVDLSHVPAAEAERRAREAIANEIRRPFRLDALPLARWTLIRLDAGRHILVCMDHHAVTDGWSRHVVLRELMALYEAGVAGRTPDLPAPRLQFADFAAWQRAWLAGDEGRAQIRHWTERLAGGPALVDLPYDRPHPAQPSFRGGHLMMHVGDDELRPLRAVAAAAQATTFMTVLAVFVALLRRYCGGDDLCVGTGIANRRLPDTETLVGMLINTVVLRIDLAGDPSFRALLDRVRTVTLEAYANQEAPFEKVVEAVSPVRRAGVNPLHQVTFNFQNNPMPAVALAGVDTRLERPLFNGSAKYDLYVAGWPRSAERRGDWQRDDSEVLLSWEFNTDVFDEATISRMQAQFRQLLLEAGRHPDRPISELAMADAEERASVERWAGVATTPGEARPIHALVEEHAVRTPDRVAVVAGDARITYGGLDERAERLAAALRRLGIGRDDLVGVHLGRSIDTIATLLGILKAGGAYVPIDPGYPPARRAALLDACRPRCVLTSRALRSRLPDDGPPVVVVEDVLSGAVGLDGPRSPADGESLAYVAFTSGSTGAPRAVAVPHRAVFRLVRGADFARVDDSQTWLHVSPLGFDASTLDIWAPLASGGRLALMPDGTPSLDDIEHAITAQGVTAVFLTTGLFELIARERLEALSGLQQVITGGEVGSMDAVRRVSERFPGLRVIHAYGPTENTTFTTCHAVTAADLSRRRLPIGRPIAGTTVHVLDERGEPCPIGIAGELWTGGLGLARGYWNDPAATAERFVVHPRYGRLYRTGDVCRVLPDGTLEFIGRRDRQVKIRGHRIEPAEIERALQACPGVASAVVEVRGESAIEKTLVAYVAADRGGPVPTAGDLRAALRQVLPDYALPSEIHVLDRLPLTPNGKIDHAALAASPAAPAAPKPPAPRTPMEDVVSAVWQDVLGRDDVGIHDNFFDIGGHSLAALRVLSLVKARTGVELHTLDFFQQPTIAGLAARADRLSLDPGYGVPGTDGFLVELRRHGAGAPVFILPGGWGEANEILVFAGLLRHLEVDRPTYAVRSRAMDRSRPVPERLDDQARDVLQAIGHATGDRPFAIVGECAASALALALAARVEDEGRVVEAIVLLDPGPLSHALSLESRVAELATAVPMADVRALLARASKAVGLFGPLSAVRAALQGSPPGRTGEDAPARPRGLPRRVEQYFRMLASWDPRPVRSPVHLVLSTRFADAAAVAESWTPLAQGPLAVHQVGGDHRSYIREHAVETARVLDGILSGGDG
jgi:amino acid adenylation domain-containing protein